MAALRLHQPSGEDRHENIPWPVNREIEAKLFAGMPIVTDRLDFHSESMLRALLACCGVNPAEMAWILPKGLDRVLLVCCAAIHIARTDKRPGMGNPRAYCLRAFSGGWQVNDFRPNVFPAFFRGPHQPPAGSAKPFVAVRTVDEPTTQPKPSAPRTTEQSAPAKPVPPPMSKAEQEEFRRMIAAMPLMKQNRLTDDDGPWIDNSERTKKR